MRVAKLTLSVFIVLLAHCSRFRWPDEEAAQSQFAQTPTSLPLLRGI